MSHFFNNVVFCFVHIYFVFPLQSDLFLTFLQLILSVFLSSNFSWYNEIRTIFKQDENVKSWEINQTRAVNPTLHGLKSVASDTGGGHYGHPLENDPRGHFCGLEVAQKKIKYKGCHKKKKKQKKSEIFLTT